jgi:hypothetical protein
MNLKLWGCIVVLVAVAHLALLFIIDHWRKLGQPPPPPPPEPAFSTVTTRYQDEKGEDVKVVQEFKITTKFADPELLKKLPPIGTKAPPEAAKEPPEIKP